MSSRAFTAVLTISRLMINSLRYRYTQDGYTYSDDTRNRDTRIDCIYHRQSYHELIHYRSTRHDYSRYRYTYPHATSRKGSIVADTLRSEV